MAIEIEKGIPVPALGKGNTSLLAVMRSMEVGESFVLPLSKRSSVGPNAYRCVGAKFSTRKIDAETIRVWRTA
jgi:hypothetical protein